MIYLPKETPVALLPGVVWDSRVGGLVLNGERVVLI